ncbi:MAG: uracil-DNA glycosylase family protein [Spirochaetaceae bacterium]
MRTCNVTKAVRDAAAALAARTAELSFEKPVAYVYHPLSYAWSAHEQYILRYAADSVDVLFVGMNPGPWGMAQTGIPFGEVQTVRGWLDINASVGRPEREHPRRPVSGLAVNRSEVSGARLWGLFRRRFVTPQRFFVSNFVANYCPLLFLEETGRNRTPDKLRAPEREALFAACDEHLRRLVEAFAPSWVIGIGGFAEKRIRAALHAPAGADLVPAEKRAAAPRVARVLHPSPASPKANRGWAEEAEATLVELGVWSDLPR